MGDLLETSSRWLDSQRHRHLTRMVAYHRGNASVSLLATVASQRAEQVDEHGLIQQIESRDYLIRVEDLELEGERTLPQAGDLIKEPGAGPTAVYEVMSHGGEPPFRYSDPYRQTFRIHTKYSRMEE
jgi:hypothetical protein